MSEENYIPLRSFITENFLRDLILFSFLFVLFLSQAWENFILLLFPLITYGFSIFFRMIHVNKWKTEFNNIPVRYYPLGTEKKHANRLSFCALLQLILLFWIGAESLYHPQLIDDYTFFFITIFIFLYTFGFFWIFIDSWKYTKIEFVFNEIDYKNKKLFDSFEKIISFLKIKSFKKIIIIIMLTFLISNGLNVFFSITTINIPFFYFSHELPGTGIENSDPMYLSYFIYFTLIIPPILSIIFFKMCYSQINNVNMEKLNKILNPLPEHYQKKVIENLKALNKRFQEELELE